MRTRLLVLFFFVLATIPAYRALLTPDLYSSHDLQGHVIRLYEFKNALDDDTLPVRWAKRLNGGLGYPFFNFNYPGFYYLASIPVFAGLTPEYSIKLIMILTFPLSGFFAYLWLKDHFDDTSAIVGGLFYAYVPYHFVNVYVRGNPAEALALAVLPLVFYVANKKIAGPIIIALLILFHNLTAFIFLPVVFLYSLIIKKHKEFFYSFIIALLLTAFFWIPAVFEKNLVQIDSFFDGYYTNHFPSLKNLIYSPWGYGFSMVGKERGEMSVQIGIPQLAIFILSFFGLPFIKSKSRVKFFIFLFAVSLFLMLPNSKPIWDTVSSIRLLQFPWRLLSVLALSCSFLAASLASIWPKKIFIALALFGLLFFNKNHWRINESYIFPGYLATSDYINSTTTPDSEHNPIWFKVAPESPERFLVASGSAQVESLLWKTGHHQFKVVAKDNITFIDRTVYYPGWTVYLNGNIKQHLPPEDLISQGLIAVELPAGEYLVETRFNETPLRLFADFVSLVSLIMVLVVLFKKSPYSAKIAKRKTSHS